MIVGRSTLNLEDEQKGCQGELKPAMEVRVLMEGKSYDVPVVYSPELTIFINHILLDQKDFRLGYKITAVLDTGKKGDRLREASILCKRNA